MSRIKYGNGEYHRIGYNNKTYRKIAFGTGPIHTLISYTATRASYIGSAAFTSTKSLASASNASSTTSYKNSYVKTYNYSVYYSGSATTSVKNITYVTQIITSSKSTYYTTTGGNASMTYNIPVKVNETCSSWNISRSSSRSSQYTY